MPNTHELAHSPSSAAFSPRRSRLVVLLLKIGLAVLAIPELPAQGASLPDADRVVAIDDDPVPEIASRRDSSVPLVVEVELAPRTGPNGEPRPLRPGADIPLNVTVSGLSLNPHGWAYATLTLALLSPDGEAVASQSRSSFPQMRSSEDAAGFAAPTELEGFSFSAKPGQQGGPHILESTLLDHYTNQRATSRIEVEVLPLIHTMRGPYLLVAHSGGLEFDTFFNYFYRYPSAEWGEEILAELGGPRLPISDGSSPPLVGFFALFFHRYPELIPKWRSEAIMLIGQDSGDVLSRAIIYAEDPSAISSKIHEGPSQNDLHWGAFMATGDVEWVDPIIAELDHLDESEDFYRFAAAWTALWSLCANSKKHEVLRDYITTLRDEAEGDRRALFDRILDAGQIDAISEEYHATWNDRFPSPEE